MSNRVQTFSNGHQQVAQSEDGEFLKIVSDNDLSMANQYSDMMSQNSQMEEICPQHQDLYVAYDKKNQTLLCNKCIYNECDDIDRASEQLTFTSYVASQLKDLFDEKFSLYRDSLNKMDEVKPEKISSNLQSTVKQFFTQVENQIKHVESQMVSRIMESKNLKELENILAQQKSGFGIELDKQFEKGKTEIEGYVQKGQYSVVVQSKDNYEQLIKQMETASSKMLNAMEEGQKRIEKILVIKPDRSESIGKRLNEIVDGCLEIDIRGDQNLVKRQRIMDDSQKQRELENQKVAAMMQFRRQQEEQQKKMQEEQLRIQQQQELQLRQEAERIQREKEIQEQKLREEAEREKIRKQQEEEKARREEAERLRQIELEKIRLQQEEQEKLKQLAIQQQQQKQAEEQRYLELQAKQAEEQKKKDEEERAILEAQKIQEEQAKQAFQEQQRLEHEKLLREQQEAALKLQEEQQQLLAQQQEALRIQQEQERVQQEQQQQQQDLFLMQQQQQVLEQSQNEVEILQVDQQQPLIQDQNNEDNMHQMFQDQEQYQKPALEEPLFIQDQQQSIFDQQMNQAPASNSFEMMNFNEQQDIQHQFIQDQDQIMMGQQFIQESVNDQFIQDQNHQFMLQPEQQQLLQQEVPMEAEIQSQPDIEIQLQFDAQSYSKFYRNRSQSLQRLSPVISEGKLQFKLEDVYMIQGESLYLSKLVNLAIENRIFMIGGAPKVDCVNVFNNCKEFVYKPEIGNYTQVERKPMTLGRAAFGCAVYPNQTQIFVCGGSINSREATKQCERYIVKDDAWKRLPDLNEPKFSNGLCFFNNGSTLYSFGGLLKSGDQQFVSTDRIESLSKGQNTWKILEVKLPKQLFDMGSIELIESHEILLFGGFTDQPESTVYSFRVNQNQAEGTIVKHVLPDGTEQSLQNSDFFLVNGIQIKISKEQSIIGREEVIVTGHQHIHSFDKETRMWRTLPQIQGAQPLYQ
eukprot:403352271